MKITSSNFLTTRPNRRFRFIRDELLGPERYFAIMDVMIAQRGLTKEQLARNVWMDNANLKMLSDKGHIIGLHSYSHPTRLEQFSADEQRQEYQRNFDHITATTGIKPISMSHPCNSYNADTLAILRNLGIQVGFCSNMSEVKNRSALEICRLDHADILKRMAA
jgi:peptidoglycan/xylan/chitin deacetylase (PgdA/CDA1 family)